MEHPVDISWVQFVCVPGCGPLKKRRGKCKCDRVNAWKQLVNALPESDREFINENMALAEQEGV